jgi:hypothetical protein
MLAAGRRCRKQLDSRLKGFAAQLPSDPSVTRSAAGLNTSSTNSSRPSPDHSASRCVLAALRDSELAPWSEKTVIIADA